MLTLWTLHLLVCTLQLIFVTAVGVPQEDKDTILTRHNALRNSIANGQVPNQPRATNMQSLQWDDYLAQLAQQHVNKCVYEHNKPQDSRWVWVGQNLARQPNYKFARNTNWNGMIQMWFNEHVNFTYPDQSRGTTGHYTQVVWAKTMYVGCGYIQFKQNNIYYQLYACNYGPGGNFNNERPYENN